MKTTAIGKLRSGDVITMTRRGDDGLPVTETVVIETVHVVENVVCVTTAVGQYLECLDQDVEREKRR